MRPLSLGLSLSLPLLRRQARVPPSIPVVADVVGAGVAAVPALGVAGVAAGLVLQRAQLPALLVDVEVGGADAGAAVVAERPFGRCRRGGAAKSEREREAGDLE